MTIVTSLEGLITIERIEAEKPTNRRLPERRIHDVRQNVLIQIIGTKFLKRPITFLEDRSIAVCTELSVAIIACDRLAPSPETEVNAVHFDESED